MKESISKKVDFVNIDFLSKKVNRTFFFSQDVVVPYSIPSALFLRSETEDVTSNLSEFVYI